jgi:hypothetical protein
MKRMGISGARNFIYVPRGRRNRLSRNIYARCEDVKSTKEEFSVISNQFSDKGESTVTFL